MQGIAHETQDAEQIQLWKEQLNLTLRNIASPNVCLWSHIIRREHKVFPDGEFEVDFDRKLNQKYAAKVCQNQLMMNELYLTVVFTDGINEPLNLFKKTQTPEQRIAQQLKAMRALDEVMSTVRSALAEYKPQLLTTYFKNGHFYSEVLTFLDFLINGKWQQRVYPSVDISMALPRVRPFFGKDTIALEGIVDTQYGACLSIAEYPETTEAGLLNSLLSAPFSFVLTQSFKFLSKPVATQLLMRQQNRLVTTGDLAQSQVESITDALDDLTSNRVVYGEHHLVLTILAKSVNTLNQHIANVKSEMAELAIIPARESTGLAAAYWSQLPANNQYCPRPAPISSRNFAGFCSFHNYPTGHIDGNQWGSAVTLFKSTSGAPYYFNFHEHKETTPQSHSSLTHISNITDLITQEDNHVANNKDSRLKDEHHALGNTLIIGASGSGKTVLQGFLISQSKKFHPTQIIFDKDHGLEVYVRACRGLYLPLQMGKPTGFNPFHLEDTPENRLFLTQLLSKFNWRRTQPYSATRANQRRCWCDGIR